ncbi:MAG: T9SS type A sorting domain-containing protein [Bacteroidetes bacterium]|nr:T9SS type A sorting domain-containing protein [Bacteroidota bacterium]
MSLTNALLKGFAGDGTYTVQIAPTNNGNVTVNIGANVLTGSNFKANEFKIYFKKSTGFKNIAKLKGVTIYPNPSSGFATISTSNLTGDVLYEISTLQGKAMVSGKLDSGINTLDLNNLPKGIYLVRVSNNGLVSIDKLVIE